MYKAFLLLAGTGLADPALAQPVIVADSGDSAWVLAATLIGMFAILPGLALFHGRGRAGPTGLALFAVVAAAALLFAAIGYSLAFGPGTALIGGLDNAFLANLAEVLDGATISEAVFVMLELSFALFACAILAASVAERSRFGWLLPFAALWLLLVYVPLARWVWAGWLGDLGAIDLAGALPVQLAAGTAAFVIALLLRGGRARDVQHDSRLAVAGAALAWVGWLGLIGASTLGASEDAALALVNGLLAVSSAVLAGMVIDRASTGSLSVYGGANVALAGLAAISAGAVFVGPPGAMAIGVAGACAYAVAGRINHRLGLGSAAAAFAIHGLPAATGTLLFPLLMLPALGGSDFAEGSGLVATLAAQGIAVLAVMLWTAVVTTVAALAVSIVIPMKARDFD